MKYVILLLFTVILFLPNTASANETPCTMNELSGVCYPVRGGIEIGPDNGYGSCSGGFVVRNENSVYLMTAGHCVHEISLWSIGAYAFNICENLPVSNWVYGNQGDVGIINLYGCSAEDWVETWGEPSIIDEERSRCFKLGIVWNPGEKEHWCFKFYNPHKGPEAEKIKTNTAPAYPGEEVCLYARERHHSCGIVEKVNQTILSKAGYYIPHTFTTGWRTGECMVSQNGDSGGAITTPRKEPDTKPEAEAVGILIMSNSQCGIGYEIGPALEQMGVYLP